MRIDDFFKDVPDPENPWGVVQVELDRDLMLQLVKGTVFDGNPLETALSLTRLVRREYEAFGTDQSQVGISEDGSREVLRTLRVVLQRQGIEFKPPWRDFPSFHGYWVTEGGYGSWQARREIIEKWFRPVQDILEEAEEKEFIGELTEGVSPHSHLGWTAVALQS